MLAVAGCLRMENVQELIAAADDFGTPDELLEPRWNHGGYCDESFAFAFSGGGRERELKVRSERTCHRPLDQEELEVGESDVACTECQQARYRMRQASLVPVGAPVDCPRP